MSTPGSVRLTDGSGDTYVWDGVQNLPVTDTGDRTTEVTVTLTITYTGSGSYSGPQLSTMWDGVVSSYDNYALVASDATNYTDNTAPSGGNSPKAIKDFCTAQSITNYGLKFGAADNATTWAQHGDFTISDTASTIQSLSFTNGAATKTYTVRVGVWGINGFEQKAGDTYVIDVTPTLSNNP